MSDEARIFSEEARMVAKALVGEELKKALQDEVVETRKNHNRQSYKKESKKEVKLLFRVEVKLLQMEDRDD